MVALFEDPCFSLQDFFFCQREFESFDNFDGYFLPIFFIFSSIYTWKVPSSYFLIFNVKILNSCTSKVCKVFAPFIINALFCKKIFLGIIEPVSVFEGNSILYFFFFIFFEEIDGESFEADDFQGHFFLLTFHHEHRLLDELEKNLVLVIMESFNGFWLYPWHSLEVLRLVFWIGLPDVGVEASEVGVEEGGVFLNQMKEVLFGEHIFFFVQTCWTIEIIGVFLSQTCHVRLNLHVFSLVRGMRNQSTGDMISIFGFSSRFKVKLVL